MTSFEIRDAAKVLVKYIGVLLAYISLLAAPNTYAIGLGELTHRSFLGQPLDATIKLIGTEDISSDNLIVRRVSHASAEKLGVDLLYADIRYTLDPVVSNSVMSAVQVTTSERIVEPYINILVELVWPGGIVYREYALLFDAPPLPSLGDAQRDATATNTEVSSSSMTGNGTQARGAALGNIKLDSSYTVRPGDTLSGIVMRVDLANDLDRDQAMLAIFQNNPRAFQNNNINLLKAGARLRVPAAFGSAAASKVTNSGLSAGEGSSIAVTEPPDSISAKTDTSYSGRLTLSEPNPDAELGGADYDVPQIRDEIDGTQEMIDLLVKENQELRERIENIESSEYLTTLTQLVSMQREQIRELQEQFRSQVKPDVVGDLGGQEELGTTVANPLPIAERNNTTETSLSQILAANFIIFIGAALIGLLCILSVVIYAVKKLSSNKQTTPGEEAYNAALASMEMDLDASDDFVMPSSEEPKRIADAHEEEEQEQIEDNAVKVAPAEHRPKKDSLAGRLKSHIDEDKVKKDEEVKARIKQKTEDYKSSPVSSQTPAQINDLEIDVLVGVDEEVNELLSMAKIYCSAGKYSEARAILSAQQSSEGDPRLADALKQIDDMERESEV